MYNSPYNPIIVYIYVYIKFFCGIYQKYQDVGTNVGL